MPNVTIDISQLDKVLSHYANELEPALEEGLDAAAKLVLDAKHRQIRKTYSRQPEWVKSVPVQRRVKGKYVTRNVRAKWKRKSVAGGWAGSQEISKSRLQRIIKDVGNPAKPIKGYPGGYAEKLATLPTSPDGVDRANPAAAIAAKQTEPQLAPVCEAAIRNKLGF